MVIGKIISRKIKSKNNDSSEGKRERKKGRKEESAVWVHISMT